MRILGNKKNLHYIIRLIVLSLIAAVIMFPAFWMVMTSIKPVSEWITYPPVWISKAPTLVNYKTILGIVRGASAVSIMGEATPNLVPALLKGVLIVGISTLLAISAGIFAAFSISRYKFGGSFFPLFILTARMFPPIAIVLPLVVMYSWIGAIDTYWGIIIVYAGFSLPYSVLMMKGFIDTVPRELEEASYIDGLSPLRSFFKRTVPLVKSGIYATALFIWILNWCEFLIILCLSYGRIDTPTLALSKLFSASAGTLYGPQSALGTVAIIPPIVIGLLIQKSLVKGFTFGLLK